jgi:hypothetical protein
MENSAWSMGSPEIVLPTNMSPAASYRKYVSCTPIKLQPARKWTDVLEGHAVYPEAQKEAAPFLNECAPISSF